jgi:hypothetical protein
VLARSFRIPISRGPPFSKRICRANPDRAPTREVKPYLHKSLLSPGPFVDEPDCPGARDYPFKAAEELAEIGVHFVDSTLTISRTGISRQMKERYRRLVYICDWLPPDFGAVGQYAVLSARELATKGYDVTLAGLSTFGNSDHTETMGLGRYREIKLATASYDKSNALRRLFWTAKTNTRLIFRLWNHMRAADTILFTGSPPLFLHWIAPANLVLKKELVYRITDFHPECAIAQAGGAGPFLKLLYRLLAPPSAPL